MNAATLPTPRVTAAMIEAATYSRTAVVVQDAAGAVFTLDRLTDAQAADPDLVVLADYGDAVELIAGAGGRPAAAAKMLTVQLAQQHARGLL